MATGPKNRKSTQKTVRMPNWLVERISTIGLNSNRTFSNTVTDILAEAIDEYEERYGRVDPESDEPNDARESS
jgi:predicted DNA-binding protein